MELTKQELVPWTRSGGATANTNAQGAIATASQEIIADRCAIWSIGPDPLQPTKGCNAYWYQKLGADKDIAGEYAMSVPFWLEDPTKPVALEMEARQDVNSDVFDAAIQLRFSDMSLRCFDWAKGAAANGGTSVGDPWMPTGIAGLTVGKGRHLLGFKAHRTLAMEIIMDSITLDDNEYPVKIVRQGVRATDAMLATGNYGDKLNFAWQLDFNPAKGPYRIITSDMGISYA